MRRCGRYNRADRRSKSPRPNCLFDGKTVMNRFLPHLSKPLALLAIVLLLVQQAQAASCCCRGDAGPALQADCCSQVEASCCGKGSCDSKSGPCQCPGQCCNSATPDVFAFSVDSSLEIDLSANAVQSISLVAHERPTPNSLSSFVAASSPSGKNLCARLCRFLL